MAKTIILNGNDVESEYAIRLLLQLSYDKSVRKILKDDLNLVSMVKKIVSYQYPNKRLIRYSESLVWILENHLKSRSNSSKTQIVLRTFSDPEAENTATETGPDAIPPAKPVRKSYIVVQAAESDESDREESKSDVPDDTVKSKAQAEQSNDSTKDENDEYFEDQDDIIIHKNQVFMSFDSASRDLCLRVKNDLKNFGFNIWMNDEKFNNLCLEETIDAIRSSECVILCKCFVSSLTHLSPKD